MSTQILGTLCAMFTAGKIVASFGWQGPFYLNGILSLPYFISWMYLVYDSPSKHPRISEEEKDFLESSKEIDDRGMPTLASYVILVTYAYIVVLSSTAEDGEIEVRISFLCILPDLLSEMEFVAYVEYSTKILATDDHPVVFIEANGSSSAVSSDSSEDVAKWMELFMF
uniref:(California timema) hypothetical protein n=1 Tax=Timema californicum TaxID=61474 RepID=A0A7R9JHW4_TIMCA|nr:unnamed protein product [Timema californicum]